MKSNVLRLSCLLILVLGKGIYGQSIVLDSTLYHLRNGRQVQWDEFPESPEGDQLRIVFTSSPSGVDRCIRLRQYNVNEDWKVFLNEHLLGQLVLDEKDMISYFPVSAGWMRQGQNELRIVPARAGDTSNDIRIGQITLLDRPLPIVLREATVELEVGEGAHLLPSRVTIVNSAGSLQSVGDPAVPTQAVRPGFVYSSDGRYTFGLPAGEYTLYATRGPEYSVDSLRIILKSGDHILRKLSLKREVNLPGWVSSDTHIHTYTHSGHGDATDPERVITLAGEGIELPVLTDHNVHADLRPVVKLLKLEPYFTLIQGVEVTTGIGHFNVFPVEPGGTPIQHRIKKWDDLSLSPLPDDPALTPAVILNHARDLHSTFRPFDPRHHVSSAGQSHTGWLFPANAMEVVNSGATQSDELQLFKDWFGLLNRGYRITPVGSSDSHTVSRYLVGQARTYIQCADSIPGKIDPLEALRSFRAGGVSVSYGLMTELWVDERFGPGMLAVASDRDRNVKIRVSGPSWLRADRVSLYANGVMIYQQAIQDPDKPGTKWEGTLRLPAAKQDVFLVAIAKGPNLNRPFWQLARPYQPTTLTWRPKVLGASGAVFIDADGDGRWSSAYDYAFQSIQAHKGSAKKLIRALNKYDESTAIQAAALLNEKGEEPPNNDLQKAMKKATGAVRRGFHRYKEEWALVSPHE